jgi:hypothetical protein
MWTCANNLDHLTRVPVPGCRACITYAHFGSASAFQLAEVGNRQRWNSLWFVARPRSSSSLLRRRNAVLAQFSVCWLLLTRQVANAWLACPLDVGLCAGRRWRFRSAVCLSPGEAQLGAPAKTRGPIKGEPWEPRSLSRSLSSRQGGITYMAYKLPMVGHD